MTYPATTALYAGVFALLFLALSAWVVAGRASRNVLHGDGGDDMLLRRIRTHGNFAEHVPFIMLLVALLEAGGGAPRMVHLLLGPLLLARLAHPFGMLAPVGSMPQYVLRGGAVILTWIVLAAAALLLLARSLAG